MSVMPRGFWGGWLVLTGGLLLGCQEHHLSAPDPARPFEAGHLMKAVFGASRTALRESLGDGHDPMDWETVRAHAAILNESSYLLMAAGRSHDAAWTTAATESLRQGSLDLFHAAGEQNLDKARRSFAVLERSCTSCHRECDS